MEDIKYERDGERYRKKKKPEEMREREERQNVKMNQERREEEKRGNLNTIPPSPVLLPLSPKYS